MLTAINAWTFEPELTARAQISAAGDAGFDGIELVIAREGLLTFDTPLKECEELARIAADLDLKIVSLASAVFWQTNYADPEPAIRRAAAELTVRMLDHAVALGAEAILVVPAVVGKAADVEPRVSYSDALHRTFDALRVLRHEAEQRGVTIALENVHNRFLLSPLEAAELIDRINSAYVGWYFDIGNVMTMGYPEDWITTLAGRIKCVHIKDYDLSRSGPDAFCELGAGSVDWPRVSAALRQVGFGGALTFEGVGTPVEIRRRLEDLIAGRPITERTATR